VILFAFEAYKPIATMLANAIVRLEPGQFRVARFDNAELHLEAGTNVAGKQCAILGSIAPPDEQLLSFLLLAHTLKKEGASDVTAVLPYLGYTRHDKDKPGQSMATPWVGSLVKASACDRVLTVDVHSQKAAELYPVPVVSLSPAGLFAKALASHKLSDSTIVAPDEGAIKRCEEVRRAAGRVPERIPYFEKHRTETGIQHAGPIGGVGRRVVIVDDILDTGGTLISACELLEKAGVEEINVMVTHGLFTGTRWRNLYRLGVRRIFCTDSVPQPSAADAEGVVRLSIVPLMSGTLSTINKDG
jgi:ribose-phosphate pyrophosphokinase